MPANDSSCELAKHCKQASDSNEIRSKPKLLTMRDMASYLTEWPPMINWIVYPMGTGWGS